MRLLSADEVAGIIDLHECSVVSKTSRVLFQQHKAQHGFDTARSATGCSQVDKAILPVPASACAYILEGVPCSCVPKSISKVHQILQLQSLGKFGGRVKYCYSKASAIDSSPVNRRVN